MDESRRDFLKKAGLTTVGAGVFMTGLSGCGGGDFDSKVEPVYIGCPIPRASVFGQNGERGMILAKEEINAAGGIDVGGVKRPMELVIIDTRDEEPTVPTSEVMLAIEKLILQKKVKVLMGGPCMSECSIAALDIYAKHRVIDLATIGGYTPTWDQKTASDIEKYKYSFRVSGSAKWFVKEAVDLLDDVKAKFGFNKMFITIEDSLVCRSAADAVQKLAEPKGWKVVGYDRHPITAQDFSVMLNDCKKSGAEVMFTWVYTPESAILLRQWADLQVPALPLGFCGAAEDPGFWKQSNGKTAYAIATLCEAGVTPVSVTPKSIPFYNAYEQRWKVPPRSTGSASAYDGAYIMKDGIERAGSLDPDALSAALKKTNLPTVRGTARFDQNHQIINGYDPETSTLGNWIQWQDGKRITVFPHVGTGDVGEVKLPPVMTQKA
jgi:branched-chain amino acid transport system substrate-binding protein